MARTHPHPSTRPPRTVVLGMTNPVGVAEFLRSEPLPPETVLVVNHNALPELAHLHRRILALRGCAAVWRPALWRAMLSRPEAVHLICGPRFFHHNVLRALRTLCMLLRLRPAVTLHVGGERVAMSPEAWLRYKSPESLAADALVLVVVLLPGAVFGLGGLLAVLAAALAAEAVLRGARRVGRVNRDNYNYTVYPRRIRVDSSHVPMAEDPRLPVNLPRSITGASIALDEGTRHQCTYTHDERGRRVVRPAGGPPGGPEFLLFGASYAYGDFLDDSQTIGWALQARFPGHAVVNHCFPGADSWRTLSMLRDALAAPRPPALAVVIFTPSSDHFLHPGEVLCLSDTYKPLWLSRFGGLRCVEGPGWNPALAGRLLLGGLVHSWLRLAWARLLMPGVDASDISRYLLRSIRTLCEAGGLDLLVAAGHGSAPFFSFFEAEGFAWVDCTRTEQGLMEDSLLRWSLLPFDTHPNAQANERMAKAIGDAVERLLADKAARPADPGAERRGSDDGAWPDTPMDIYPLF